MNDENPWISVDDEMPPEGLWVRVWVEKSCTPCLEDHDCVTFYEGSNQWNFYNTAEITHWQHIVGPKKPSSPIMVEAPCNENMIYTDRDPNDNDQLSKIGGSLRYWWNNSRYYRLWYWHNDKWNRAI